MPEPHTPNSSPLEDRLRAELKTAQRERDQVRIDTLRSALNAFHIEEVARTDATSPHFREPLTEDDRLRILDKQIKQRDEAARIFRSAHRDALAEKEERELAILREYGPQQMTTDELRALVSELVAQHGKIFNKVMPLAARETKGRADGRALQQIVRELTA